MHKELLEMAGKKAERMQRQQWVWWQEGRYHITAAFRPHSGAVLLARVFGVGDFIDHTA